MPKPMALSHDWWTGNVYNLHVDIQMLSKHPLEIPPDRKLTKGEVADALRLAIIAELDAISLYLQLARAIDDEKVRKVFEDVAREEKTHVGEFLALLKGLDPELVAELEKGAVEVAEKGGDPPQDEWAELREAARQAADSIRVFRRYIPTTRVGRGVEYVPVEREGVRDAVKLVEISAKFKISQAALDYAKRTGQPLDAGDALRAAAELALEEDRLVAHTLLNLSNALKMAATSWDEPGKAVAEVSKAVAELIKAGAPGPYILFVDPARFAKLVSVYEKTGVMELTRIKAIVKDVVPTPVVPPSAALLISASPQTLDLVIGADTEVEYLGPEDGKHLFRLWETIAVRVRQEKGVAVLREG
ncbi:Linocin_M18 bacteriocin protein [Pyrobaculum calidifontis JCM 11548]|uniref:Linocin_M18 bacteriocin protein n=2 Tax=Pyrobaculum calidifontis TaxID=181486 RepID=A3MVL1_PYRCJ|nr:Linocin_M18 bacteriocin protein [Pyrobaculum calidifontis JCM 11548]